MENKRAPRLIINPIGGLANRMRALASGVALANKIWCDFSIVWRLNAELNADIDDIFELPAFIRSEMRYPSALEYNLKYSAPRKKNLYLSRLITPRIFGYAFRDSSPEFISLIKDNNYGFIKETVEKVLQSGKDCLIQSGLDFYPYSPDLYRDFFKPADDIERNADSVMKDLGEHSIGLHIRRSDNSASIKHSPDSLFMTEMDAAISENPDVRFYLATDDEETKKKFAGKYGERVVFSKKKAKRNTAEGIKDAATEMLVLSKTDRIIGSFYSSFSEAAALLGDKKLVQVFKN